MSHIYIYSPSGAVRDKAAFQRGVKHLSALGHQISVDPAALKRVQRFAGDDADRLVALSRTAASGANAALISRGGYGLTRLLPDLPFKDIARSIRQGMAWVGYSDFTALQLALLTQTGSVTWSGPSLCDSFGAPEVDEIAQACFDDLLLEQGEGSGWRMGVAAAKGLAARKSGVWARDAQLWGGNLTVLCSLLGTPYFPSIDGGVLFLEDVGEHPYRIERMLSQLLHAGVLARQKAIVLGQFTEYRLTEHDQRFGMSTVLQWLRAQLKCPVLTDLPFGHVATRVCLPVGAKVDLLVEGRDAMLVWGHI
ncbi:MAG: LD-carboxypeptidase [Alphaproteobacteria bacterium]|nr:LD-carboxypeptidase [Alphaproteobacteria bacterium]